MANPWDNDPIVGQAITIPSTGEQATVTGSQRAQPQFGDEQIGDNTYVRPPWESVVANSPMTQGGALDTQWQPPARDDPNAAPGALGRELRRYRDDDGNLVVVTEGGSDGRLPFGTGGFDPQDIGASADDEFRRGLVPGLLGLPQAFGDWVNSRGDVSDEAAVARDQQPFVSNMDRAMAARGMDTPDRRGGLADLPSAADLDLSLNADAQGNLPERYRTTTTGGEIARTATRYSPGLIGGPGAVLPTIAAAAADETAGQTARALGATQGQENAARLVAGLGAGFVRPGIRGRTPEAPVAPGEAFDAAAQRTLERSMRGTPIADIRATVERQRAAGADPVLADAMNSSQRGRVRAAASKDTPAQQAAIDFAEGRRVDAQDYAAGLGERLSPETRSPAAVQAEIDSIRQAEAAQSYGPIYEQPVAVTPEIMSALEGAPGRAAMMRARAAAEARRLPDQVAEIDALMGPNPPAQVSTGVMDRIRIAMEGRAAKLQQNPNTRDVAGGLFARGADIDAPLVGPLEPARAPFREAIGEAQAVEAGAQVMRPGGTREYIENVNSMTPGQRQAAAAGARSAWEDAVQTPAGAASAMDRMAVGRGLPSRVAAIDPAAAQAMQEGAVVGREQLTTARQINPRDGSPTNLNREASDALDGVSQGVQAVAAVKTGGLSALVPRAITFFQKLGISDAEAQRIVSTALTRGKNLDRAIARLEARQEGAGRALEWMVKLGKAKTPAVLELRLAKLRREALTSPALAALVREIDQMREEAAQQTPQDQPTQ